MGTIKYLLIGLLVFTTGVTILALATQLYSDTDTWSQDLIHLESSLRDGGMSERGIEAIVSKNPHALLSIDDMTEDLRAIVLEDLTAEQVDGYGEVSEFHANEIVDIENFIIGTNVENARITLKPALLPDEILNGYQYIGYTHPNYSVKKSVARMKNDTLRRVYRSSLSGRILIIEQSRHIEGAGATLVKEAVNASVADLPAIFGIKKSESNKTYASLNWTSETQAFVLYLVGDFENAKEDLIQLGSGITHEN